jgi:Flp pilus assembly protein TadG
MFALIALVIIVGVTAFGAPVKGIVESLSASSLHSSERRGQVVIAQQLPQTSRRRHNGHLDRGAAAVEMALVMPILMAMIIGIIDFSRIFNAELQLSQAAREGVRLASLRLAPSSTDIQDIKNRAVLAAPNPAFGAALTSANVTVVTQCPAQPTANQFASVQVSYVFQGIFWMKGSTLTQTAVMRCSG